jgi:glutaredoxin
MNKKLLLASLIGIIILGGIIFWAFKSEKSSQNKPDVSGMIFFYGEGCSHCKNVEKFLEENKNIEEKVKFAKLEVWGSKENASLMIEKAKICGMSGDSLPVPFFWDESKCITGDVDIIELLKEKANQ